MITDQIVYNRSEQMNKKQKAKVRLIDNLMMVASTIHPLTALPQVYIIYSGQNVEGVSLLSWLGFMVIGCVFLAYGIAHKLKPFIINQVIWFAIDLAVVIGIILFS